MSEPDNQPQTNLQTLIGNSIKYDIIGVRSHSAPTDDPHRLRTATGEGVYRSDFDTHRRYTPALHVANTPLTPNDDTGLPDSDAQQLIAVETG